jgi:autotransporter translocation and assembly factor TamB
MQVSETVYVGYEQGSVGTSNIMTIYTKLTKRLTAEARTGDTSSLRLFYTFELD